MPKAKSSFNPLQLVSPVQLVFCVILFFMPWVELQCVLPASEVKNIPKEESEKMKKEFGIDPAKPVSMVSQSGLQIATGGSSAGSDMKKIEESMKKSGMNVEKDKDKDKSKDDTKGAPLLFLYPVLLLAGIVVAFLPIPGMIRRIAVAGCCGAALGLVGLQALIGFPIENELKKKNDEMKGGMGFMLGGAGAAPPAGDKAGAKGAKDAKSTAKEQDIIRVSWQFSLYLTFLLLLGAAGTAFLDGLVGGGAGGKSKYGKKGRRDDYDDDDEDDEDRPRKKRRDEDDYDDEDDRPKKKKRRDDDYDDEDDRPRKKKAEPMSLDDEDDRPKKPRRQDDDDEDDRPRKKPRRDEGDEDDRPRKKKPLEPEFEMPAPLPPPPPAAPAAPAGPNPFDFDSQEQPKKKPRRRDDDDDDDDDRPRKKRRRDDD